MSDDSLQQLYPFLGGGRKDPTAEAQALRDSVAAKARDSLAVKQRFFDTQAEALIDAARTLADSFAAGGRLFTMGNGGSSCDAAHLAVEFQHPVTTGRPALPAINLCNDTAMTSAVGNDVGFDQIFARQIEAHGRAGDTLAGFSTSGNSDNLMAAFRKARELGLRCIGFAGGDGGQMAASGLLDHCLVVPTSSIHRVQETHVACYHILWDLVHTLLADRRGSAGKGFAPSPRPSPPLGERGNRKEATLIPEGERENDREAHSSTGVEGTTQKS
ncbi:MAG TPA: SIS domain-containing protein, partial [Gammaproteobacteria bacterium]|nr:SIS domain-containing protein [Gammaproteobacteria bacterium]